MNELVKLVARQAGITPAQAEAAVLCVFTFLTARLPSPLVGRIREQLNLAADSDKEVR